jgi:GTPase SAR1 family protein
MGKISKIVVCGHTGVGKTAAIEQLIFGNHIIGTVRSKLIIVNKIIVSIVSCHSILVTLN